MQIEHIARVCHEANRAIQIATGDPKVSPHWDDAPQEQRASAIEGVIAAMRGATPRQLHESWLEFKASGGWIYGPEKDEVARTHPCFVPYDELPEEQKSKDAVFSAIVGALREGA
ncbi:RyR domain-containing protein [Rhodococcus erythropolis]|uniref:RyR domain-containing protein n=1 Tax=Rhodococcus erythropolis TaxID=1833 RepID=UPI0008768B40|nr:RyR domain-containing protein [Rhodococcus erythropolis]SCZ14344.1 RyR domain-containing protein [Rhodococcus erythropolis]